MQCINEYSLALTQEYCFIKTLNKTISIFSIVLVELLLKPGLFAIS